MTTLTPTESPGHRADADRSARRGWLLLAAGSSLVAGATHVWVVPEHLEEWVAAAAFFVVLAVLQVVLAVLLLVRPAPAVLLVGALGTLGLVVFYVLTRTVDLPLLPPLGAHSGSHLPVEWGVGNGVPVYPGEGFEEVGTPDLVCLASELVLLVSLLAVLPPRARRRTADLAVVAGGVLLALRVLGVLA
jgi:hypothetical protein